MTAELYELAVRDLLFAARPAPELAADWADVLRRGAPRRRRRLLLAAAVLVVLLVAVGASLAAVGELPWWQSAEPASPAVVERQLGPVTPNPYGPPNPDQEHARTVVRIDGATLVAAPVGKKGGYCLVPSLEEKADLGSSCMYQATDMSRSLARGQGAAARWIIYGRFVDPRAARLDLTAAAGEPFIVPLQRGGFFLAAIPPHLWARLDGGAGRARVLEASGAAIDAGCVQWGSAPDSTTEDGSGGVFYARGEADSCRPAPRLTRPGRIDVAHAEKLVEFRLHSKFGIYLAGTTLALWRAPADGGWVCTFHEQVPLPRELSGMGGGGGSCTNGPPHPPPADHPIISAFSVGPAGVFDGEVSPAAGIVRMGFRSAAGE